MPDNVVTMDYMLEPCWIVGDPSECANRLDQLYDEVDGFGYVLTTTHDELHEATLSALEENLDFFTRCRGWKAHAQRQYLDTLRAMVPDFGLVSYEDEGTYYTDLSLVYAWRSSMKEFREEVARMAPDIECFIDQDTGRPNSPHEMIERVWQRLQSDC